MSRLNSLSAPPPKLAFLPIHYFLSLWLAKSLNFAQHLDFPLNEGFFVGWGVCVCVLCGRQNFGPYNLHPVVSRLWLLYVMCQRNFMDVIIIRLFIRWQIVRLSWIICVGPTWSHELLHAENFLSVAQSDAAERKVRVIWRTMRIQRVTVGLVMNKTSVLQP